MKVLYITGYARSGSTVLARLLGELDGFFAAGEMAALWRRGVLQGYLCTCGEPLVECGVWSQVLAEVAGDHDLASTAQAVSRRQEQLLILHRVFPFIRILLQGRGRLADWPALDQYVAISDLLYRTLATITKARVIIDSSKGPAGAAVLTLLPSVEPYFVHLIRDPRGVAYSWRRRKKQPTPAGLEQQPRAGPAYTTFMWIEHNIAAELVCRRIPARSVRVLYEDFVADPAATTSAIVSKVEDGAATNSLRQGLPAELTRGHYAAGNPDRFEVGPVRIREDDEWRSKMGRGDFALVTGATLPLLRRYGYPLTRSDPRVGFHRPGRADHGGITS